MSRRLKRSALRREISTFSCDIAYAGHENRPDAQLRVSGRVTSVAATGTMGIGRSADGQAALFRMGCEPDLLTGRPCDLSGCAESTNPSVSFCPLRLQVN